MKTVFISAFSNFVVRNILNTDFLSILKREKGLHVVLIVPDYKKEYFKERMITWSESQSLFAAGRKALLSKELSGLSSSVQEKVKDLFNKFDESIAGAQVTTVWRKKMSFEAIAKEMGYYGI